jgi:hypothetical protein
MACLRRGDALSSVCLVCVCSCVVCVASGTRRGRTFTAAYAGRTFTAAHTLKGAHIFFEVNLAAN